MKRAGSHRSRSWVEHLRAGGTTPWAHWSGPSAPHRRELAETPLPGAQQLELLRRLNLVHAPRVRDPRFADRVLAASALGRGRGDLPLAGDPAPPFGSPPVDPAALPAAELLRVAALMLADDLAARPGAAAAPHPEPASAPGIQVPPSGRRRAVRRGWRLVGDPWVADQLRAGMRSRGHRPGGRRALVYVLAGPLDRLLADVWTHRCLRGPERPWADWVAAHGGGPATRLPPGADAAGTAAVWARRAGPGRVVIVTDPTALPRLLGVRRLAPAVSLGAEAVELARLVAIALDVVVDPGRRPAVLRELLPLLGDHQGPARPLRVPAAHLGAVGRRAVRQRERIRRAGYAVHGDLGDLLASAAAQTAGGHGEPDGGPAGPEPDGVLGLAARVLLAGAPPEGEGGPP